MPVLPTRSCRQAREEVLLMTKGKNKKKQLKGKGNKPKGNHMKKQKGKK
jgi:hypothetical protein